MKKLIPVVLIALAVFAVSSCKKDGTKGDKVRYQIAEADNYITQITYTDGDGVQQVVNSIADFDNGDKTITVSDKPFVASLAMEVNNTTPMQQTYTLVIYVNDSVQKYKPVAVPPNAIYSVPAIKDTVQ